jgi:hypothetical protein
MGGASLSLPPFVSVCVSVSVNVCFCVCFSLSIYLSVCVRERKRERVCMCLFEQSGVSHFSFCIHNTSTSVLTFSNYIQTKEFDMRVRLFGHINPRTQRAQVN